MTDKMTIHSIAGYCNEKTLWKLLVDLSSAMLKDEPIKWKVLMPNVVMIDGEDFCIEDGEYQNMAEEFYPPEGIENYGESGFVWSVGALICYASSGHFVFGGRGGTYQQSHPSVELPTLRREHSNMTPLVQRCLCYTPSQRISLKELYAWAIKGTEIAKNKKRVIKTPIMNDLKKQDGVTDDVWPETMC